MASLIGGHATDAGRHRSHCQLAPGAGSPVQLAVTVSVSPSRGVPTIAGAPVITGTVAVCADATTGTRQASARATAVMTSGRIAADLLRTEHPQPFQPTPPRSAHPLVKRLGQHCDTANFAQLELNDSRGTATPMHVHHTEDRGADATSTPTPPSRHWRRSRPRSRRSRALVPIRRSASCCTGSTRCCAAGAPTFAAECPGGPSATCAPIRGGGFCAGCAGNTRRRPGAG